MTMATAILMLTPTTKTAMARVTMTPMIMGMATMTKGMLFHLLLGMERELTCLAVVIMQMATVPMPVTTMATTTTIPTPTMMAIRAMAPLDVAVTPKMSPKPSVISQ